MILDYSGGPDVQTKVLIREAGRSESEDRKVGVRGNRSRGLRDTAGFKDEGRSHRPSAAGASGSWTE